MHLAKRDADGIPVERDADCDEIARRVFSNWIPDRGQREIRRELRADERRALEVRAAALADAMLPYDRSDKRARAKAEAYLAAMFAGFRSSRQQDDAAEAMVDVTAAVLRGFPLWVITRVCLSASRGEDGFNPRFAPNDSELYAAAQRLMLPYRKAMATTQALLSAPVEKPVPPPLKSIQGPRKAHISTEAAPPKPVDFGDGRHAQRVMADIAARRADREAQA